MSTWLSVKANVQIRLAHVGVLSVQGQLLEEGTP